jgi:hypothetical protein
MCRAVEDTDSRQHLLRRRIWIVKRQGELAINRRRLTESVNKAATNYLSQ